VGAEALFLAFENAHLPWRQAEVGRGETQAASDPVLVSRVEFVKLSKEYDTVNLGQGFPDFSPPDFAVEAFQKATSGDFMLNQYTLAFVSLLNSPGVPEKK
jgi:hypothetical protein